MPFRDSGQLSNKTTVCGACHRMVRHLRTPAGELVITDPEVITVVSYDRRASAPRAVIHARRLHAELCERYREQARRSATSAEMRAFTATAKRGRRGTGL